MSILDSKGYKYTCEVGVLNISKGTRIVMKGKRSSTKLCVAGFFVASDVVAAAPSMLDDNIIMSKVSIHDNSMDMLTKSLSVVTFGHYLNLVGICQ